MQQVTEQQKTTKRLTGFALHPQHINRKGAPPNPEKRMLQNALRDASRKHNNVEFLHHIANLAYEDKGVALAVLDKLVPDQKLQDEEQQKQMPPINIVNNYVNTDSNRGIPANSVRIRDLEPSSTVQTDMLAQTGTQNNTSDKQAS